ncbi:MAG: flagellar hook-basal body complex protein FliE [Acetobacteraceae bacterium]
MSTIPTFTITPSAAADAYDQVENGTPGSAAGGFGTALTSALEGVVDAGHDADAKSMQAIAGTGGSLTDVVTAVNRAELALQTTTAIRDRVVSAYQDIMHMSI